MFLCYKRNGCALLLRTLLEGCQPHYTYDTG